MMALALLSAAVLASTVASGSAAEAERCEEEPRPRVAEMKALALAFQKRVEADALSKHPGKAGVDSVGDVLQTFRLFDRALVYHQKAHKADPTVLTAVAVATDLKGLKRHDEALDLMRQVPQEVFKIKDIVYFVASLYDCMGNTELAYSLIQTVPEKQQSVEERIVALDYLSKFLAVAQRNEGKTFERKDVAELTRRHAALKKSLVASGSVGQRQLVPKYIAGLPAKPVWDDWEVQWPSLKHVADALRKAVPSLREEFLDLQSAGLLEPDDECLETSWHRYEVDPGWRPSTSCATNPSKAACLLVEAIKSMELESVSVLRASYSTVAPDAHILPHFGMTNGQLKFHLGLFIPPGDCATIRVDDQRRTWREGDVIVIDDSFNHEVWNNCSAQRTVFQLVIVHPDAASQLQSS